MTDHNHADRVESLHLRLRVAHDAGDKHALTKALGDTVFGCVVCAGDVLLTLLGLLRPLDSIDRSYMNDRLCELHPAEIDQAGIAALFAALSVDNEVEAFPE
jgi:hypothetical protein